MIRNPEGLKNWERGQPPMIIFLLLGIKKAQADLSINRTQRD